MKRLTHGGIWMACAAAAMILGGRSPRAQDAQQPTFRASVDLVAVNVQVVDHDGRPVGALGPDKFDVTIGGKHRRVVSADFLETGTEPLPGTVRVPTTGAITTNLWPSTTPGQTFVLAIDVGSFGVEDSRGVM